MFLINYFTEASFCLDLSQELFYIDKDRPNDFSKFNIFSYLLLKVYEVGSCFGFFKDWKEMQDYEECIE